MRLVLWLTVASALSAAACTLFSPATAGSSHNYAGAAVFGGSAVAATGVNRALTGDCWAACPTGRACNRETGTCDPLPCSSGCPADLRCERVGGEDVCVQPKAESAVAAVHASAKASADASDDVSSD